MRMPMSLGKDEQSEPVFIVGAGRSGTTLLRLILNSHPELAIFGESGMFFRVEKYALLSSKPSLERFLKDWRLTCAQESPYPDLVTHLNEACPLADIEQYTELMTMIMKGYAELEGKSRWGEKTPAHVHRLGLLMQAYPKAKVIHMVRDPRAMVCSAMTRLDGSKFGWVNAYMLVNYWRRCERAIEWAVERNPERIHRVSYEELVKNPVVEIKRICEFLELSFHPEMLEFSKKAERYVPGSDGKIQAHHAGLQQSVNTSAVDKWRKVLTLDQQLMIEWVSARWMARRGYVPEIGGLRVLPLILLPFVHAVWLMSHARRVAYRLALRLFWRVRIAAIG